MFLINKITLFFPSECIQIDIYEISEIFQNVLCVIWCDIKVTLFSGTRNMRITTDIKFDNFSNIGVVVDGEKSPDYNISSIISSETWKAIDTLSRNINKEILQNIPLLRIDSNIQCNHQIKLPNCRIQKCLFNLDLDPCEQFNLAEKYPMLLKFLELLVKTYKLSLLPQDLFRIDQRSNPKYFNYTWNSWI